MATKSLLGYNPYRDSEGKSDDGPTLLASRGRPKVSASDQRKKIDEAKAKLRSKYAIEERPDREKVLDGPKYIETPGFAINEQNLSDNDVRTILWRDKELFPGKTYGQYYETEKAKKGDIFMMSAAEYRQALVESGQYKDLESIENRMDWEKVDQYTEDMMSGDKFPPPQLWYDEDGKTQQEGLHRLYAAERVGIESIPVVVSSDTRNQDIYPYNQLSDKILSQADIHNDGADNGAISEENEAASVELMLNEEEDISANIKKVRGINQETATQSDIDYLTNVASEAQQEDVIAKFPESRQKLRVLAADAEYKLRKIDEAKKDRESAEKADDALNSMLDSMGVDESRRQVIIDDYNASNAPLSFVVENNKDDPKWVEATLARAIKTSETNDSEEESGWLSRTTSAKDAQTIDYPDDTIISRAGPLKQAGGRGIFFYVGADDGSNNYEHIWSERLGIEVKAKDYQLKPGLKILRAHDRYDAAKAFDPEGAKKASEAKLEQYKTEQVVAKALKDLGYDGVYYDGYASSTDQGGELTIFDAKNVIEIDSQNKTEDSSDNGSQDSAIEAVFVALSSYGEEHTQLQAKLNDLSITPSEEEALEKQIKQVEKDMRAETDKVLDAIKSAPASSDFLEELAQTIEAEQEIADRNGDELYLTALDKIVLAIGKKQGNPSKKENKAPKKVVNQISVRDYPDLYDDMDIDTDDLGCIMLDLEPMKVMEHMEGHEDDLFENPKWDQGSVPAETVPHVTLLYGLLENGNVWKEKVDTLLKDWSVKSVKIDHVGFFDTPDSYAVVAHLEKTPELVDGHERLTLLPHINTFSEYLPHMTLAYVKKEADVDVWVKNLGKQYNGKRVKAAGINYGDKPEDDDKDNNNLNAVRASLASLGQEHNSLSQSGLIVAYNALDSESRDIIKSQETALKAGFQNIERRIVAAATERVAKNYLEDASDLISKTERKKFEQETQALLTTFYINLYPIFGRQLLAKRATEYGVVAPYQMNASTQSYIEEMAEKAAVSHVNTVIQDLLAASSLVYAALVTAALVGLVTAAIAAGNVRIKKKLLDANYTEEQIEQAVEAGVFDDTDMYKEAQSLARQGEGQAKIVQTIQNKYQDISKNRATTIARTESARVFNQSQFEADKQFLNDAGLMDKAYKKLRSRTGTPCDHCEMLINKPPIPFMKNFADLGTTLRATETKPDGTVKVKTLPINWEAVSAGNVHPNCNCEYVLIIKDN